MSERNPEEKASEIVSPTGKITADKGELSEEDLKQVSGGGLGPSIGKQFPDSEIHLKIWKDKG